MASPAVSHQTGHTDTVHDVQLDYYGKRLATCSSDRTIKLFEIVGEHLQPITDLNGHEGPVWQVAWAHPKFGGLLASCSFDHKVILWKQQPDGNWVPVHESTVHTASVNGVAFAPYELGLQVAAASSDGSFSVHSYDSQSAQWGTVKEDAHSLGCTAVSWCPATPAGSLVSGKPVTQPVSRLVTAGCDNTLRVWQLDPGSHKWREQAALSGHSDWVRDAAWAPNLGLPMSTIASCGQDGQVLVWSEGEKGWSKQLLEDFGQPIWKVSWSVTGGVLAVSDSSGTVSLWKETADGKWQKISRAQQ
eukprot:jgi/Astpho2/53/e_gw1.00001.77.1_t